MPPSAGCTVRLCIRIFFHDRADLIRQLFNIRAKFLPVRELICATAARKTFMTLYGVLVREAALTLLLLPIGRRE